MSLIDRAADLIHALYHALDNTAQHMGAADCKCHEPEAYVMDKDVGDKLNAAFSDFTDGDEDGHEAVAALRQLAADHVALTLSRDEALAALAHYKEELQQSDRINDEHCETIESLRADLGKMREAMEPFARIADDFDHESWDGSDKIQWHTELTGHLVCALPVEAFRNARRLADG